MSRYIDADNQLSVNENRSLCKLRHKNGNCLCAGGFCTAVNDEICKSIRMSYEKGYVDGKTDAVRHGKWSHYYDDMLVSGTCSVCGWRSIIMETDVADMLYCPNCGSRMDLEGEEE